MKKRHVIIISIIIVILILLGIYFRVTISGNAIVSSESVIVTKENLQVYLEKKEIVRDLPKNALISVRLYNLNQGERQWEESYIIKKRSVEQGKIESPDLDVIMNSKYVSELGDLCSTIKKAKTNGDFGFDAKISKIAFLWKYKGMLKYRKCFGY